MTPRPRTADTDPPVVRDVALPEPGWEDAVTNGAICNGGVAFEVRVIEVCPNEHKRRRIYGRFQHWYGWEWYCLGCGDRWNDEEFGSRPFERGWRAKAIARHKAKWDGVTVPARDRRRAWRAFMDAFFAEMEPVP